jgi:hypothetical protein
VLGCRQGDLVNTVARLWFCAWCVTFAALVVQAAIT